MKYQVEVTFVFEDVEANSEEEAKEIVDGCLVCYTHHPNSNNIVNPNYYIYEEN